MAAEPLQIGGTRVAPGERVTLDLPLPALYTHAPMAMPVVVVRGRRDGPRLFVAAAPRGDELAIRAGVQGVLNVMRSIGMLPPARRRRALPEPFVARFADAEEVADHLETFHTLHDDG